MGVTARIAENAPSIFRATTSSSQIKDGKIVDILVLGEMLSTKKWRSDLLTLNRTTKLPLGFRSNAGVDQQ